MDLWTETKLRKSLEFAVGRPIKKRAQRKTDDADHEDGKRRVTSAHYLPDTTRLSLSVLTDLYSYEAVLLLFTDEEDENEVTCPR